MTTRLALALACFLALLAAPGCDLAGDTLYSCSYEVRSTSCSGYGWSEWESRCFDFDLEEYLEGISAEDVCDTFSGSQTECASTCCIDFQYRDNQLSTQPCGG